MLSWARAIVADFLGKLLNALVAGGIFPTGHGADVVPHPPGEGSQSRDVLFGVAEKSEAARLAGIGEKLAGAGDLVVAGFDGVEERAERGGIKSGIIGFVAGDLTEGDLQCASVFETVTEGGF